MSDTELNVVMAVASLILSTGIAVFLFYRAKREPRPVYVVTGNTVVRAHTERQIEVLYRGKDVPIVTRTEITFWNAGRQPIRRADIVEDHPLTVVLPDGADVLEARVIARTRPEIDFLVMWGRPESMPDGSVRIKTHFDFSFLNHRDGGTLEILHTGDDPFSLAIEGAIVGVHGPPRRLVDPRSASRRSVLRDGILTAVSFAAGTGITLRYGLEGLRVASILFFGFGIVLGIFFVATLRDYQKGIPEALWHGPGPSPLNWAFDGGDD